MYYLEFSWKDHEVDLVVLFTYLKETFPETFDGLICSQDSIKMIFSQPFTEESQGLIANYWDTL